MLHFRFACLSFVVWLMAGTPVFAQSRHADPALEALLPEVLGGIALIRESQSGIELKRQSEAFDAFLKSLGKGRDAFVVASAYAPSGLRAEVGAWRVTGASGADILPAFRAALQGSSDVRLDEAEEMLAGRRVLRFGSQGQLSRGPLYAMVGKKALFFVQTSEKALATEAIGKLGD